MFRKCVQKLLLVFMVAILLIQTGYAAVTSDLVLSQVVQDQDGVMLYANLLDSIGGPSGESFTKDKFTVMVDGEPIAPDMVADFNKSGEGVHYIVCVDISKSLTEKKHMKYVREALESFVTGNIGENDRMSLLSFGSSVKRLSVATADGTALLSVIGNLRVTDKDTQLYEAIYDAVTIGRTGGTGVPERSVVIIITDGTDDPNPGKSTIYTYENIQSIIAESHIPVYTVAMITQYNAQNQNLSNLERFAEMSGGILSLVEPISVIEELSRISGLVENATLIHAPLMNTNDLTGLHTQSFMLTLNTGNRTISARDMYTSDLDWDLLPKPTATPTPKPTPSPTPKPTATPTPTPKPTATPTVPPTVPPTAAPTAMPTAVPTPTPEPTPEPWPQNWISSIKNNFGDGSVWYLLAAAFLIIALIILLIIVSSSKRKKKNKWQSGNLKSVDIYNSMREYPQNSMQGTVLDKNVGQNLNSTQQNFTGDRTVRDNQRSTFGASSSNGTVRIQQGGGAPTSGTVLINTKKYGVELRIQESRNGAVNEHSVYLDKQITIGRDHGCDLRINDETVSSMHLRITQETDGLYVRDLNSANGTRINGEEIRGSRPLHNRDILVIGYTTLTIQFNL